MPIANIHILEGRSAEQREQMIASVTRAISESLTTPIETIRVIVVEVPRTHWAVGGQTMQQRKR